MSREKENGTTLINVVQSSIADYFTNTTVHGLRYLVEPGRPLFERLLWGMVCVTAIWGCYFMSDVAWTKYLTSPTITVVESTGYSVANIPFPAVTICEVNRVNWQRAQLYQEKFLPGLSEEQKEAFFKLVGALSPAAFGDFDQVLLSFDNDTKILESLPLNNVSHLMYEVRTRCEDFFATLCWWRNKDVRCCELFELQRSETGWCYSFNSELSMERKGNSSQEKRPRRTSGKGIWSALRVRMYIDQSKMPPMNVNTTEPSIIMMVHDPQAYPSFGTSIIGSQFTQISVVATASYAIPSIRNLKPARRNCLYPDEMKLRGFGQEMYVFENCLSECHHRHALTYCNCTPYFFPEIEEYTSCGIQGILCLTRFNGEWISTFLEDPLQEFQNKKGSGQFLRCKDANPPSKWNVFNYDIPGDENEYFSASDLGMNCSCLQGCRRHVYTSEIYQSPLGLQTEKGRTSSTEMQVFLDIHFRHPVIVRYRTEVTFDWITLTIGFGGIAGLFLGFSLLSAVELVYYFTLRALGNQIANKEKRKTRPAPLNYKSPPHAKSHHHPPVTAWSSNLNHAKTKHPYYNRWSGTLMKPLEPVRF